MSAALYDLLFEDLPPMAWWQTVEELWTSREFGMLPEDVDLWRDIWETAESTAGRAGSPLPVSADTVTLYRGFDDCMDFAEGFAWSLSETIARCFMDRCGRATAFSALARVTVPRGRVIFYTNDRQEQEAVIVPQRAEIRIIDVVTKESP